ncbi:MAG: hypothetical protein IT201_02950 [Thermoleophilia bacterium]|nr:hypothetical protein [Thermoleophilia bacterium]
MSAREKPPVPFYWWPLWLLLLAGCLFVFYVLFTPVWIGVRLVAWLAERAPRRRAPVGGQTPGSDPLSRGDSDSA